MAEHMSAARASIDAKIVALEGLRETLNGNAIGAALMAIACHGKVIVTGIGKSGHVGRKICATFQSTGQPAAFLHPAEAAHGDLGMIGPGDTILMLSNSGETDELEVIMDYALSLAIPVIMITSRVEARLARRADIVLAIPRTPEGDPIGRAPMASTTAQLAMGDALAAALMASRGFSPADFAKLHHGGYLGRVLAEVA